MSETIKYKDGEPCDHSGCLNHVLHPYEGCNRIAGSVTIYENYENVIHDEFIGVFKND